jgi:uncharacterized membrane protein HdeD (DUF308 family)
MNKQPLFTPGFILIVLGIVFLIANLSDVPMRQLWPAFVVAPGLYFFGIYFSDRENYGVLMPAAILTTIGLLFFYCVYAGWWQMRYLWPIFMLAPGVGFFLMYFLGRREWGLLIPAGVLSSLGGLFLVVQSPYRAYWPLLLIAAGIIFIVLQQRGKFPIR